jgi:hypothetical protein
MKNITNVGVSKYENKEICERKEVNAKFKIRFSYIKERRYEMREI